MPNILSEIAGSSGPNTIQNADLETNFLRRSIRLLLINPNSSHEMTHAMEAAIKRLELPDTLEIYTYTGPKDSPASINDGDDIEASTKAVLSDIQSKGLQCLHKYDGILVACYSVHTLVEKLYSELDGALPVTGIFESSILTSMILLPPYMSPEKPFKWGIVTTGKFWEGHLSDGVVRFLGLETQTDRFAGVQSTGLDAGDFHSIDPEEVRRRLKDATLRLLDSAAISVVVMGCAGMVGLEEIIRTTAAERYGDKGKAVFVVDGVKCGILQLEQAVRSRRTFGQS